jgi:hypothetical protein
MIGFLGIQGHKWAIDRVQITPDKGFSFHATCGELLQDLEGEIEVYSYTGSYVTCSWDRMSLRKGDRAELTYVLHRNQQEEIERETLKAQLVAAECATSKKKKRRKR